MRQFLMRLSGRVLLIALPLLALATGCTSHGSISGKVTYQNRPLTGGTVLFTSTAGKGSARSQIEEDGSYTIAKMPTGPVKVAVETLSAQPPPPGTGAPPTSMRPPKGVELPPGAKSGIYNPESKTRTAEPIPEHYADPDKSELTYTVTGGSQVWNIELK